MLNIALVCFKENSTEKLSVNWRYSPQSVVCCQLQNCSGARELWSWDINVSVRRRQRFSWKSKRDICHFHLTTRLLYRSRGLRPHRKILTNEFRKVCLPALDIWDLTDVVSCFSLIKQMLSVKLWLMGHFWAMEMASSVNNRRPFWSILECELERFGGLQRSHTSRVTMPIATALSIQSA